MANYLYQQIFDEAEEPVMPAATTEETTDAFFDNLFDERAKQATSVNPLGANPAATLTKTASEWDAPIGGLPLAKGARVEKKQNAAGEKWVFVYDESGGLVSGCIEE